MTKKNNRNNDYSASSDAQKRQQKNNNSGNNAINEKESFARQMNSTKIDYNDMINSPSSESKDKDTKEHKGNIHQQKHDEANLVSSNTYSKSTNQATDNNDNQRKTRQSKGTCMNSKHSNNSSNNISNNGLNGSSNNEVKNNRSESKNKAKNHKDNNPKDKNIKNDSTSSTGTDSSQQENSSGDGKEQKRSHPYSNHKSRNGTSYHSNKQNGKSPNGVTVSDGNNQIINQNISDKLTDIEKDIIVKEDGTCIWNPKFNSEEDFVNFFKSEISKRYDPEIYTDDRRLVEAAKKAILDSMNRFLKSGRSIYKYRLYIKNFIKKLDKEYLSLFDEDYPWEIDEYSDCHDDMIYELACWLFENVNDGEPMDPDELYQYNSPTLDAIADDMRIESINAILEQVSPHITENITLQAVDLANNIALSSCRTTVAYQTDYDQNVIVLYPRKFTIPAEVENDTTISENLVLEDLENKYTSELSKKDPNIKISDSEKIRRFIEKQSKEMIYLSSIIHFENEDEFLPESFDKDCLITEQDLKDGREAELIHYKNLDWMEIYANALACLTSTYAQMTVYKQMTSDRNSDIAVENYIFSDGQVISPSSNILASAFHRLMNDDMLNTGNQNWDDNWHLAIPHSIAESVLDTILWCEEKNNAVGSRLALSSGMTVYSEIVLDDTAQSYTIAPSELERENVSTPLSKFYDDIKANLDFAGDAACLRSVSTIEIARCVASYLDDENISDELSHISEFADWMTKKRGKKFEKVCSENELTNLWLFNTYMIDNINHIFENMLAIYQVSAEKTHNIVETLINQLNNYSDHEIAVVSTFTDDLTANSSAENESMVRLIIDSEGTSIPEKWKNKLRAIFMRSVLSKEAATSFLFTKKDGTGYSDESFYSVVYWENGKYHTLNEQEAMQIYYEEAYDGDQFMMPDENLKFLPLREYDDKNSFGVDFDSEWQDLLKSIENDSTENASNGRNTKQNSNANNNKGNNNKNNNKEKDNNSKK